MSPCELGMSMTYCMYRLATSGVPTWVLLSGIKGKASFLPISSDTLC